MRALGLDIGSKTIGVALTDEAEIAAHPLTVLARVGNSGDSAAVLALCVEHAVTDVVVGMPYELSGRIGRITTGSTAPGSGYFPLTPCRVLDTRNPTGPLGGPPLQPAGSADRAFFVTGICGIPPGAVALSVNATVTLTGGSGTLSLYRGDGARTGTWSISFGAGQTRANNDLLQLALDQSGSFRVQNSAPGNVDFVLDVTGYFK